MRLGEIGMSMGLKDKMSSEKKKGRSVKDHNPLPLTVGRPSKWKWMQQNIPGLRYTVRTLSSFAQHPLVQSIAHQLCLPLPTTTTSSNPRKPTTGRQQGTKCNKSPHSADNTAETFYGKLEAELVGSSKVYVKDKKHQDRCWKGGSFGKGTLSRGEATWYARQLDALKQTQLGRGQVAKGDDLDEQGTTTNNLDSYGEALSRLPTTDPERYLLMPEETLFLIYAIGTLDVLNHDVRYFWSGFGG